MTTLSIEEQVGQLGFEGLYAVVAYTMLVGEFVLSAPLLFQDRPLLLFATAEDSQVHFVSATPRRHVDHPQRSYLGRLFRQQSPSILNQSR